MSAHHNREHEPSDNDSKIPNQILEQFLIKFLAFYGPLKLLYAYTRLTSLESFGPLNNSEPLDHVLDFYYDICQSAHFRVLVLV